MTNVQIISVHDDIAFCDDFLALKRKKKLSAVTNDLWRAHFNINKQSVPSDMATIEDELRDLAVRKVMLDDKKRTVEKKMQAEKERYQVIE